MARKKKKKNRMPPELVEAVRYRADNMCEVMNPDAGCTGRHEETHHRKMRSQQGKHTMENCVAACNACHGYIHRHPAIAYTNGWLVKGVKDPAKIPFRRRGVLSFLRKDGGMIATGIEPLEI